MGRIRLNVRNQQDSFKACLDVEHEYEKMNPSCGFGSHLLYHAVHNVTKEPL